MFKSFFKKPEIKTIQTLLDFKHQPKESFNKIITRCDQEIGGYSKVDFKIDESKQCGKFFGHLNLDLPKDNPDVTRSGYAMFRTKDHKQTLFSNNNFWDWSMYSNLVLRVNGDKRKYLVNIQSNTPLITDLFQHRLFLNTPGEWETVVIPLNDFVMTNWGVIQEISDLNKNEVKTVGIGLLDKQYGPFELNIDWIKVMTDEELGNFVDIDFTGKKSNTKENSEGSGSAFPAKEYPDPKSTIF